MKNNQFIPALALVTVFLITLIGVYPVKAESNEPIVFNDSAVAVYSPVNMTYNGNSLILNLTIGSAGYLGGLDPEISMNYSIDGLYSGPVPLRSNGEMHVTTRAIANLTLPKLTDGPHTLTLYLYGFNQRVAEPKYLWYTNTVYFSTIGNPAIPTANPTVNPTPSIPELSLLIVAPLMVSLFAAALMLHQKRNAKLSHAPSTSKACHQRSFRRTGCSFGRVICQ